jgi:hypothetical protein
VSAFSSTTSCGNGLLDRLRPSDLITFVRNPCDIYELFWEAEESGAKFLLGTCLDLLVDDGQHTISAVMKAAKVRARRRVEVRDAKGAVSDTTV